MKELTAIIRKVKGGNITHVSDYYQTKGEFKDDLKGNGYIVLGIYTKADIELIKDYDSKDLILCSPSEDYIYQVL
jgi:hypothetical protein